jgi:hypothetical protein
MKKFKPPELGSSKREIYDIIAAKYNNEFGNSEIAKRIISEYKKIVQITPGTFVAQIRELYIEKQRVLYWIRKFKARKKAYDDLRGKSNEEKKKVRQKKYREASKLVKKYSKSLTAAKYHFYHKYYHKIDIISSDHKLKKYIQNEKKVTGIILKKIVTGAYKDALGFTEVPIKYVNAIINNTIIDETKDVPDLNKYFEKIRNSKIINNPGKDKSTKELEVNGSWCSTEKLDGQEEQQLKKRLSASETKIQKQAQVANSLLIDHKDKESRNLEDEIILKIDGNEPLDLLCEAIENLPNKHKDYIKKQYLEKTDGKKKLKMDTAKQIGVYSTQISKIERKAFESIRAYMKKRSSIKREKGN